MDETTTWGTSGTALVQVKLSSEALTLTTGNRYFAIDCQGGTASTHSASVILKTAVTQNLLFSCH